MKKPDALSHLPEAITTRDDTDPTKAHVLDPPHVVESIIRDYRIEQGEIIPHKVGPKDHIPDEAKKLKCAQPGETVPLSQWEIDVVKMRIIIHIMRAAKTKKDLAVKHLRFPTNNVNEYTLAEGNPPPDPDRRRHERGFRLEVDPLVWPQSIMDLLESRGVTMRQPILILSEIEADKQRRETEECLGQ